MCVLNGCGVTQLFQPVLVQLACVKIWQPCNFSGESCQLWHGRQRDMSRMTNASEGDERQAVGPLVISSIEDGTGKSQSLRLVDCDGPRQSEWKLLAGVNLSPIKVLLLIERDRNHSLRGRNVGPLLLALEEARPAVPISSCRATLNPDQHRYWQLARTANDDVVHDTPSAID